jgi:hypothetical protein
MVVFILAKNVTFVASDLFCLALKSLSAPTHISRVIIRDDANAI